MHAILAAGLTKRYGADRGVIDLSFTVAPGEVFGYLGPNGAGKTTTIRLLLDLARPTSGSVQVLGLDPRRDGVALRRRLGVVPGDLRLYERLTGREILRYFASLRGGKPGPQIGKLAEQLDADLDRPVRSLSKGNRQKIGLIQALAHRPELLVLDEPTSGLDPLVQEEVLGLLREAAADGRTVFLSSHALAEVQRVADRVAIIRDGRLVLVEGVESLRARALGRVAVSFTAMPPEGAFDGIPGLTETGRHGNVVTLALQGPADGLVKALAHFEVVGLDSTRETSRTSSSRSTGVVRAMPSVFAKSLRDLRRSLAWWSVGLVGMVAMMTAVYPSIRDNPALNRLVQDYPEALKAFIAFGGSVDYVSGAGYLGIELFSFMVPLLFVIAAVASGAAAIAGEEEKGTLDLLLSQPVTRRGVALAKLFSTATEVAALTLVLWLALWIGVGIFDMGVPTTNVLAASLTAGALGLAFGSIAFLLGATTGRRSLAIGLTAAAAVAAYLVNALAPLVRGLDTLQKASPFYHYAVGDPLRRGLAPGHLAFLTLLAVVAAAVGVALFERRDIHSA